MANSTQYQKAKFGERMIELKVCFFTDGLADQKGNVRPKHGWTRGEVRIIKNAPHGIVPVSGCKFNSLMEIPSAIETVLIKHKIQLHRCHKIDRYVL